LNQGEKSEDVPASSSEQVAGTFARAVAALADADMILSPGVQPINDKAASADETGDFSKRIKGGSGTDLDAKNAGPRGGRPPQESDHPFLRRLVGQVVSSSGIHHSTPPKQLNNR
jgi:hypothetical protein